MAIGIGDRVRSYDFPDRDGGSREQCYAEGTVRALQWVGGCERYVVLIDKDVWDGKEYLSPQGSRVGSLLFPPVNGTPRSMGGICNGVELLKEAS